MGEDSPCYSNKINYIVSLTKCPHDHQPTDKACTVCVSDSRVTNIYQSFTYKMAAKTSWHRDIQWNEITSLSPHVVTVYVGCRAARRDGHVVSVPRASTSTSASTACRASTATPSRWTSSAFSASPSSSLRRPARPRCPRTTFPSATRYSALGRAGLATLPTECETRSPKSRPTCAPAVICSIYSWRRLYHSCTRMSC